MRLREMESLYPLRVIAWREIGRNAVPAAVAYPFTVVFTALASDYWTRYPVAVITFALLLTAVGALRLWSARVIRQRPEGWGIRLLMAATWLTAVVWSSYTCFAIEAIGSGWTSNLVVIATLGIGASALVTLGPHLGLLRGYVAIIFIPLALALFSQHTHESISGVVVLIYAVFLQGVGRRQHEFYWSSLRDNYLLEQRTHELESARARTASILDSTADAVIGLDTNGAATFANPAAAHMLGRDAAQLVGVSILNWLQPQNEEAAALVRSARSSCVAARLPGVALKPFEGAERVVDLVIVPIREEGTVVGLVLTLTDVTERAAVERLKDQFVSTVSHELRTPLTSMHASLRLILSGALETQPDKIKRMLSIASTNTERLVRIVNDLLDLQKLRRGGLVLKIERCRIDALLQTARESVSEFARRAEVHLEVDAVDGELEVDADRIVQTLINLLSNAIKFSPPDSAVHISCKPDGAAFLFCVTDHGVGIPTDKQASIFDEFVQVDSTDARGKGGTGLGLAICRAIVQQHGGTIGVESESGKGSRFFFSIPCA